jgi:hypothetical protein
LILDEDAIITDWAAVKVICQAIKWTGHLPAGVPDGSVLSHRSHSYLHLNPFMAIFNCALIRPLKSGIQREEIDKTAFVDRMDCTRPSWITGTYTHDAFEPFSGLFYWLAGISTPFFLKAETLDDGIATAVMGLEGEPVCFHAWYSRKYKREKERIDRIYDLANSRKKPWDG